MDPCTVAPMEDLTEQDLNIITMSGVFPTGIDSEKINKLKDKFTTYINSSVPQLAECAVDTVSADDEKLNQIGDKVGSHVRDTLGDTIQQSVSSLGGKNTLMYVKIILSFLIVYLIVTGISAILNISSIINNINLIGVLGTASIAAGMVLVLFFVFYYLYGKIDTKMDQFIDTINK